ncbi:hydroxymethylbilane synthase [soil metagenome]
MKRVVLGTRGSDLARAQTALVVSALAAKHPELEVAIEIITTSGDERSGRSPEIIDRHAGRKGMFTAEIERALLDGKVDVAVHSAKDLPSETTPELEICAALPRAGVDDVLVSRTAGCLDDLPPGGIVATGSVRRQFQLRSMRRDMGFVDVRGNVPTRLRKLVESSWAGIVLARAGLERLGFDLARPLEFQGFPLNHFLLRGPAFVPAGGQGVIALEIRSADAGLRSAIAAVNHDETLICLRAEREFLRRLQGDCDSPVGVLATMKGGWMTMNAQVFVPPDSTPATGCVREAFGEQQPEDIAGALFERMYGKEN